MTAEHEPATSIPPGMPKAAFLNYLTNTAAPTRVRVIAGRALWVIGTTYFLISLPMLWNIAVRLFLIGWTGVLRFPPLTLARFVIDECMPFLVYFAVLLALGLIEVSLAGPVRRGRRWASRAATVFLIPLALIVLLGILGFAGTGVLQGFGMGERAKPAYFMLLVPASLGIVLLLLLKDLTAYLQWIANNPITEKPPVAFLPKKERGK